MSMDRTDFEQQINALIPRPDPETTAALFEFGQELGDTAECFGVQALLTSLQFIARNFSESGRSKAPMRSSTAARRLCPMRWWRRLCTLRTAAHPELHPIC